MKSLKEQVKELTENQKHILEAIKNLNERMESDFVKVDDEKIKDVNNLIESQGMIDQIVVKNSDDIMVIKKRKEDNSVAIKTLETKIDAIENEIMTTIQTIQAKLDKSTTEKEVLENIPDDKSKNGGKDITCKFFNRGFCKMKRYCSYQHKSDKICETHLQGTKCENSECEERHPRNCRYYKRGNCWRNESCVYLHRHGIKDVEKHSNANNVIDQTVNKNEVNDIEIHELSENEMETDEDMNNIHEQEDENEDGCQCGKEKEIAFKCTNCKKKFCDNCPTGPLLIGNEESCLECIIMENKIYTSTPEKRGTGLSM